MQKRKMQPTCSNNTILDIDTRGRANVESISIWATSRSYHFDTRHHNPEWISECNVCSLTVNQCNIPYSQLLAPMKDYSLQHNYFNILKPENRQDSHNFRPLYNPNMEKENNRTRCIHPRALTVGACSHGCTKEKTRLKNVLDTRYWETNNQQKLGEIDSWTQDGNTFVALILQDWDHHLCPLPLIMPLPLTVRWFTPWK